MALCYQSCLAMPATSACPNMLDMGCVCKNMSAFNTFSCCIQQNCATGVIGQTAWSMVQDMCSGYGGVPSNKLSCDSGSGGGSYPAGTPVPKATQKGGKTTYTTAPGYGGGVFAPQPSASNKPGNGYVALKQTSGSSSTQSGKKFGVVGALSLGLGALLLVAM